MPSPFAMPRTSARTDETGTKPVSSRSLRPATSSPERNGSHGSPRVERTVLAFLTSSGSWKTTTETSFYLSSRPVSAGSAAKAVREHWSVENSLHHVRDVTFREDASRIRTNPGIFARIRSFAHNLLRLNHFETFAQDRFARALGGIDALVNMRLS